MRSTHLPQIVRARADLFHALADTPAVSQADTAARHDLQSLVTRGAARDVSSAIATVVVDQDHRPSAAIVGPAGKRAASESERRRRLNRRWGGWSWRGVRFRRRRSTRAIADEVVGARAAADRIEIAFSVEQIVSALAEELIAAAAGLVVYSLSVSRVLSKPALIS